MYHPVQKSPEEHISEKPSDEPSGEEQPSRLEALVPPPAGLEDEQQREEEGREEVKNKAVQSRQAQDTGRGPGQGRHRSAAIVQHCGVSPHGHFTDELRSFTFRSDCCHRSSD